MPTRILFSNGDTVTVSDEPPSVAAELGGGGFAQLERPWGDTSIYVNPASVLYIEAVDERAPDIEALEAAPEPAAPAPAGAATPPGQQAPPGFPGA